MTLIAEFHLDIPFMRPTLSAFPEVTLELEHYAALDEGTALLVFWVTGEDLDGFTSALHKDETIDVVRELGAVDGRKWLWVELTPQRVAYWKMVEVGAVLLTASATHRGWNVSVRFPSREALQASRVFCRDQGYSFTLYRLYRETGRPSEDAYGLSEAQREFIEAACKEGYFQVPRHVSLAELADRFDISDQAASQRLRRGLDAILERTVMRSGSSR